MDDIEKFITMGQECYDRKDMNGAIANFNKALSLSEFDDEFAVLYGMRSNVYAQMDKTEQAIEDLKKAADYGNEEALKVLKTVGINYTPKTPTAMPQQTANSGGFAPSATPTPTAKPAAQPAVSNTNIFCSNCGNKLNGNNFCPQCGTPASQTAQRPAAQPASKPEYVEVSYDFIDNGAGEIMMVMQKPSGEAEEQNARIVTGATGKLALIRNSKQHVSMPYIPPSISKLMEKCNSIFICEVNNFNEARKYYNDQTKMQKYIVTTYNARL
jgi:tetratricopeptide (TPR) repeat protein